AKLVVRHEVVKAHDLSRIEERQRRGRSEFRMRFGIGPNEIRIDASVMMGRGGLAERILLEKTDAMAADELSDASERIRPKRGVERGIVDAADQGHQNFLAFGRTASWPGARGRRRATQFCQFAHQILPGRHRRHETECNVARAVTRRRMPAMTRRNYWGYV